MKFRKKIVITEDKKEMYYNYFDDQKSKTLYRFKNLTLYMNNDIGIDIENTIDKEVKIYKGRYDNTIIKGYTIQHADFYVHYVPLDKCYAFQIYTNLKILSNNKFIAYLVARKYSFGGIEGVIEFDIDLSRLHCDSFYLQIYQNDTSVRKCEVMFWYSNKNDISSMSDSFHLLIDINKHRRIVLDEKELPSELIDPEYKFAYERFLLRHI